MNNTATHSTTTNTPCKTVIRHAAIDAARSIRSRRKREHRGR